MPSLTVELADRSPAFMTQLRYALAFLSQDLKSYALDETTGTITCEFAPAADLDEMQRRISRLVGRYQQNKSGAKSITYFDLRRPLAAIDAWAGLLERRWATPVGEGHVILRGLAAQLQAMVDAKVVSMFAREFNAELEIFPSTITSETLHRCNHFTSFPEHMDFVSHLRQDLDVLSDFSTSCRTEGWSSALHEGKMAGHDFAISPSCCYHAYEGMEGWSLDAPGRCITAIVNCHRYEGANHRSLSRLRSFNMREVVWVGHPGWVMACRARAEELIEAWARDWELSCAFETANDMFFTDDFSVKASFQRQQEAKRELRMDIPSEQNDISVFSSNFHATTFGKAFGITAAGRPASSACVGWGGERWIFALLSQFGFDPTAWPAGLRRDFEAFTSATNS